MNPQQLAALVLQVDEALKVAADLLCGEPYTDNPQMASARRALRELLAEWPCREGIDGEYITDDDYSERDAILAALPGLEEK